MSGRNDVDGTVDETVDARLHVPSAAKGRIHLVIGVKGSQLFVGKGEMMRSNFGSDLYAARLSASNEGDSAFGGDVHDMKLSVDAFGERDIAGDHDVFGDRRHSAEPEDVGDASFMHDAAAD